MIWKSLKTKPLREKLQRKRLDRRHDWPIKPEPAG
jgi:hypothetical protein